MDGGFQIILFAKSGIHIFRINEHLKRKLNLKNIFNMISCDFIYSEYEMK
jgi:hypothetical protein